VHFSPEPFFVIDTAFFLEPKREIDLRWAYYELLTQDINSLDSGSAIPSTSRESFYNLSVRVPPLSEQRVIAAVLGSLDDKIEVNRRMSETLEGIARAIFKSWFVDFDPVRAKMEGRDPSLAPDIAALFPDRLVETDKGETPERWESRPISDLAELNPESWSRADYPPQVEYVDLAKTKWGEISDVQMFERADAPSRAQRVLRPGDTIVGTVRPGNGAYALIGREGLTGSTGFAVLRPKRQTDREFIYLAATQRSVIDHLAHLADGAAYPAVRPQVVADVEATISDPDVLPAFSKITGPLLDRIELNRSQSRTLAALRDLLLPKLMSGEIRVKDAEKLLGQAGI
jgi:type I restriction enzyme S subunit